MYENFYHLQRRPFQASPTVESYFPAQSIEQTRQTLIRILERAEGPGLVVGSPGTGKTLLLRLLSEYLKSQFQVVSVSGTRIGTRKALLQNLLFELKLPYRNLEEGELRLALLDFLQPEHSGSNGVVVLMDEADGIPVRLLEEMRLMTNLVREGQPRLRLILAGNARLDEKFSHPKLESFNQRIAARCYLEPLSHEETAHYVVSQIRSAGGDAHAIFSDDALLSIHRASDGIPRLINQVCDHALLMGCAGGRTHIDPSGIEEAWSDLQQLPAPWHAATADTASDSSDSAVVEFGELDQEFDTEPVKAEPAVSAESYTSIEPEAKEIQFDLSEQPVHSIDLGDLFAQDAIEIEEAVLVESELLLDELLSIHPGFDGLTEGHSDDLQIEASDCELVEFEIVEEPREDVQLDRVQVTPSEYADSAHTPSVTVELSWDVSDLVDNGMVYAENVELEEDGNPADTMAAEEEAVSEPSLRLHPFGEGYEEEVVIDRYEALEVEAFRGRPEVTSSESQEIASLLLANAQLDSELVATPTLPMDVEEPAEPQSQEKPTSELANAAEGLDVETFEYTVFEPVPVGDLACAAEAASDEVQEATPDSQEIASVIFPTNAVHDDRDIIFLEGNPLPQDLTQETADPQAHNEYQQLFTQLRQA